MSQLPKSASNVTAAKAEYLRRKAIDRAFAGVLVRWQRRALFSKKRRKALCAGRGSGKSVADAAALLRGMVKWKNTRSLCLSITRAHAFDTIISPLEDLADRLEIKIDVKRHEGRVYVPATGSHVEVAGMNDWKSIRIQRGKPNAVAVVDEAGEHNSVMLDYVLRSVIEPRMGDPRYRNFAEMWLSGTPGLVCAGTWYKISGDFTSPGWEYHHATAHDNPHQDAAAFFAKILAENGWQRDNPAFKREYLAKWVTDNTVSIVRVPEDCFDNIPEDGPMWHRIQGSDYGVSPDPSAFVQTRWCATSPIVAVEKVHEQLEMTDHDVAALFKAWNRPDLQLRVADTGGGGKVYTNNLQKLHELECRPAKKEHKTQQLINMANWVASGRVKFLRAAEPLADELRALAWNDQRTDVHRTCSDHMSDAFRYQIPFMSPKEPEAPPPPKDPNDTSDWRYTDEWTEEDDEVVEWIS